MSSGVNMQELGYGKQLSWEELKAVNEFCPTNRPHYIDVDTATKIKGNSLKENLEAGKSPFNVLFEYGASLEGHWTYNHMVLQLQDIAEVLDALYSDPCNELSSQNKVYVQNTVVENALCATIKIPVFD